ncbi:MAG: hypothetical protein IPQ01_01570 [Zoogloea sp.]|nr:hypothetical protein [Zoogloea sp.]
MKTWTPGSLRAAVRRMAFAGAVKRCSAGTSRWPRSQARVPMRAMTHGGVPVEGFGQVFIQAEDVDVKVFVHVNSGSGS